VTFGARVVCVGDVTVDVADGGSVPDGTTLGSAG
jgi:hypothetical protein